MEPIEIRQNKKILIPMLALFIGAEVVGNYFIYFSGEVENSPTSKIISGVISVFLIYAFYFPIRKLIKNEPVLILSNSGIEINEKRKPISFSWFQIIDWNIENDKESGTYLTLTTSEEKRRIQIDWLEKKSSEIEELIRRFKGEVERFK